MPAYTRSTEFGALTLVFGREGEIDERLEVVGWAGDLASVNERALLAAVDMLVRRRRLLAGDTLIVRLAGDDLPAVSRSGHYS
jgi:hypothetical protein